MIDFENKNWFKDPSKKDQEQKEYFDNYLEAVGLTWEDLENKKVLDMGAGLAGFGKEAQERNVDVTSLEKNPDLWKEEGKPTQEDLFEGVHA
jgi:16S rRNA A1518/A1519 N6-dimethyltransferase RsmA/KsgA/DIM1 with predicted DNA glycosylase/AP lyase activity